MNPNQMRNDESLRRTQAFLNRELFIGRGAHTDQPYYLLPKEYLETHFHLLGASTFGKSFYAEHLLRVLTGVNIPASIIDPHGESAQRHLAFLERFPRLVRNGQVTHVKPGSLHNKVGFNPFDCGLTDVSTIASLVMEA